MKKSPKSVSHTSSADLSGWLDSWTYSHPFFTLRMFRNSKEPQRSKSNSDLPSKEDPHNSVVMNSVLGDHLITYLIFRKKQLHALKLGGLDGVLFMILLPQFHSVLDHRASGTVSQIFGSSHTSVFADRCLTCCIFIILYASVYRVCSCGTTLRSFVECG